MSFRPNFCDCRGSVRPPYYIEDGKRMCGLCMKPRLPLPSDPVALLLTDPEIDIDRKTGKISKEHMENCCGCALCERRD